ncbi:MAG: helix-turn-helix transcriptional regulator [Clostridia bacterium]|nr:helix-turn-helix transcriptional regulator [Clostridia bacterium]
MVADRIKKLREQAGLTQSALAKKLCVTRSGVNAWELGISVPSTQFIVELALLFHVSTDFLLGVEQTDSISLQGLDEADVLVVQKLVEHLRAKNEKPEPV